MKRIIFIIVFFCICIPSFSQNSKWRFHSSGINYDTLFSVDWRYNFSKYLLSTQKGKNIFSTLNCLDSCKGYELSANLITVNDSIIYLYGQINADIVGGFYYKINLYDSLDISINGSEILIDVVKEKIKQTNIGYIYWRSIKNIKYIGNNIIEITDDFNQVLYWGTCRITKENLLEMYIIPGFWDGFYVNGNTPNNIVERFNAINSFQYKIYFEDKYYTISK